MSVSTEVKAEKDIDPQIRAEAERWLSRMGGGQAAAGDLQAFAHWRAVPSHAAAYEEIEKVWQIFDGFPENARARAMVARVEADVARRTRQRGPRLWLASAASVVLCATGWGVFYAGQHYVPTKTYATEFGQRSTLQLDDGSQLILNSATRVRVKFTRDSRQVRLEGGEVVVTVARDAARPFTVSAGGSEVMALGTRFQVKREASEVVVTLLEGQIALDRKDSLAPIRLTPGEQVKFVQEDRALDRRTVDPEEVSSWTQGRLKFKATPLREVLAEVNRYTRARIELADPSLAGMLVNATVEIGNSAAVVAALEAILPVEAQYESHQKIVLMKR